MVFSFPSRLAGASIIQHVCPIESREAKWNGAFHASHPSVYLHDPVSAKSPDEPDLIVLAGWMGASMRNLSKYANGYEKLYPSARIVVITTSAIDAAFTSDAANRKRLGPVLDIVYDL